MSTATEPTSVWALVTAGFAVVNGLVKNQRLKNIQNDVRAIRGDLGDVRVRIAALEQRLDADGSPPLY